MSWTWIMSWNSLPQNYGYHTRSGKTDLRFNVNDVDVDVGFNLNVGATQQLS